jgi:hypothetical protein
VARRGAPKAWRRQRRHLKIAPAAKWRASRAATASRTLRRFSRRVARLADATTKTS